MGSERTLWGPWRTFWPVRTIFTLWVISLTASKEITSTEEARAIEETSLSEAVNALLAITPQRGGEGVPVGDRLGPLLPQHPATSLASPVVQTRYTVPQGPPGTRKDVPVVMTQYALPPDQDSEGHNVLLTQISFPDGVPGVEGKNESEEENVSSTMALQEVQDSVKEDDKASVTERENVLGEVYREEEGNDEQGDDLTTTVLPQVRDIDGGADEFPQVTLRFWDSSTEVPESVSWSLEKEEEAWHIPEGHWQPVKQRAPTALELMVKRATTEASRGQEHGQIGSSRLSTTSGHHSPEEEDEDEKDEEETSFERWAEEEKEEAKWKMGERKEAGFERLDVHGFPLQSRDGEAPGPVASSSRPDHLPPHRQHGGVLTRQQEQELLAQQLHQYLYHIAQSNPQTQLLVQQLLRHQPQAQRLLEQLLMKQWHLHQQRLRQEEEKKKVIPEDNVETFNIVITKNLTGGQSRPSVQVLPDAEVDAMLLNTTISSVTNLQALKQVVDSAVGNAVASQPVAIQEAVAQVVESPGQEATVKVIDSTMPDRSELESTLSTLLGSEVVFNGASTGHVSHPHGSLVDTLLMNTVGGGDNIKMNSSSKTNVVNIFIINIISGTNRASQLTSPPPLSSPESPSPYRPHLSLPPRAPSQPLHSVPFLPLPSSGPLKPPLNVKVPDTSQENLPAASPHLHGSVERPFAEVSQQHQQQQLKSPQQQQVSPLPSQPPPPPPQRQRVNSPQQQQVTPPHQQQHQQESTVLKRPPVAPQSRPKPPRNMSAPHSLSQSAATHLNPGGILINNNQKLNLLPEFVRATTIPPVVSLYNTSVHTILGTQPSVIGLLPNKLFHIIKPQLVPSTNTTVGGIIRKALMENLTSYFPSSDPPRDPLVESLVRPQSPQVGSTVVHRPPHTQYQYPSISDPTLSSPDTVPSNPFPFLRRSGGVALPKQKGSQPSLRVPALGSARNPRPQLSPPQGLPQSPLQEYVIVNSETPPTSNDENLLSVIGDSDTPPSGHNRQADQKSPSEATEIKSKKKNKKPKNKSSLASIKSMAADAVAAVDSNMNNVMKAVAIGAVPSGIAFATALWPYWAPFVLGRRRRRDLGRTDLSITHDWLSILTGNKYKGASTEFPAAWFKKKSEDVSPGLAGNSQAIKKGVGRVAVPIPALRNEALPGLTTEHSAVKRSTVATLATTDLDQSIAQVVSSLTDDPAPADASPVHQSGTILREDMSEEVSPPDVNLVTNFLYSALHEWNDDASKGTPLGIKDDMAPEIPINLDLMAGQLNGTNSPDTDVSDSVGNLATTSAASVLPASTATTTTSTTTRRPVTRRTTITPITTTTRRPVTSRTTFFATTTTTTTTTRPATRRTTTNRRQSVTRSPTTRTTTRQPPPRRTTRTTTARATTPRLTTTTTARPRRTTRAPIRTVSTTPTPTTTTTTPTTTTTTAAPGIMERISSTLGATGQQMQSAVRFVGSVAVYGAAALMPFWIPIVLGKRRRRDLGKEEEEDLWVDQGPELTQKVMEMVQNPPEVKDFGDGKTPQKKVHKKVQHYVSSKSPAFKQYSKGVAKRRRRRK